MRIGPSILAAWLLAGCGESAVVTEPAVEIGAAMLGAVALQAESPTVFLQALVPTSGGGAEQLFDGDPETGWRPRADVTEEGLLLRFEEPVAVDAIVVRSCEDSAEARLRVYLNGLAGPAMAMSAGRESLEELSDEQSRHGVSAVYLRIEQAAGTPCIAEIGLRNDRRLIPIRPPRSLPSAVVVSSAAEPVTGGAIALVDGRLDTAWASSGEAIGERVIVALEDATEIVAVEVWNGDQRSIEHFRDRGRVRRLIVQAQGHEPVSLALAEVDGAQRLDLPEPMEATTLTLLIEDATPKGAALTELRLWDRHGPVALRTRDEARRRDALVAELGDGPVGRVLDRELRSVCGYPRRKLKLRSNTSFVRYDAAARWDEGRASIAFTGSWTALAQGSPWSTVRVDGRRYRTEMLWQHADDLPRELEREIAGEIQIAFVADLGPQAFRAIVDEMGRGAAVDRVDCLTEELGAWSDVWEALVANEAVVVRGGAILDLMWREGG